MCVCVFSEIAMLTIRLRCRFLMLIHTLLIYKLYIHTELPPKMVLFSYNPKKDETATPIEKSNDALYVVESTTLYMSSMDLSFVEKTEFFRMKKRSKANK